MDEANIHEIIQPADNSAPAEPDGMATSFEPIFSGYRVLTPTMYRSRMAAARQALSMDCYYSYQGICQQQSHLKLSLKDKKKQQWQKEKITLLSGSLVTMGEKYGEIDVLQIDTNNTWGIQKWIDDLICICCNISSTVLVPIFLYIGGRNMSIKCGCC